MYYLQSKDGRIMYTAREFYTMGGAEKWKKEFERAFPHKNITISTRPCKNWKSDRMMMHAAGISCNPEKNTMEI